MLDIIELEIKNMLPKKREEFYKAVNGEIGKNQKSNQLKIQIGNKKIEFDEILDASFREYPDMFINFQRSYENSLYNQAIKKNGFEELMYEDVIANLTQKQKDRVIRDIQSMAKYLKDEDGNDFFEEPSIIEITDEFRKIFEEQVEDKEDEEGKWLVEQNKNNKYVLVMVLNEDEEEDLIFFKDDDDLILFALTSEYLSSRLHRKYWGKKINLNPNNQVNNWIEKNYELELAQKDSQDQVQEFEEPKKRKCNLKN
ncbi:hypothetical protein [Mesomycoplasma ovipneumoniae]|uniref:hypothetical protein n=1 Tax=Mesomycoplasma ovipneumoniae TaxID=29562 RepID=UPI00083E7F60|nr:hypothetical protein [Mesomycoplasma ovipneumoniae]